jgi:hypothetical protein
LRLSIVTLGHVHTEDLEPLTRFFEHLEQLVLDIPPRDPLSQHRAELNRAVDAAGTDWILVIRERETLDDALAKEILDAVNAGKARGFRIRSVPFYAGLPLLLTRDEGEVRLFHRRNYMRYANKGEWDEVTVQGSVIRLSNAFRSVTFGTPEEHRAHLAAKAAPHSWLRQALLFASYALSTRTRDRNTLRYLGIEAGYDIGRQKAEG